MLLHTLEDRLNATGGFSTCFFDDFDQISVEALGIQTKVIPHFKALICGSLEPKKLRARPPNEAAMLSGMKLKLFSL